MISPENLRRIRKQRHLSLTEAAAEIGVDRTTWFRWEHGQRKPRRMCARLLDAWVRGDTIPGA